jgi:2-hydroxy-3-oxopropionate reductase
VDRLVQQGAVAAASPRAVAARSDIVITVVPDSPDVEAVVLGPDGALSGARPGMLIMDCSTVDPAASQRIGAAVREAGGRFVDAGMGRSSKEADEGRLIFMVGATPEDFAAVKPLLEACGTDIFHCGGPGAGITVKVINNLLAASILAADMEALVLGAKAGVDPEKIVQVLSGGLARCGVLENRGQRVVKRDFAPGFRIRLHYKDLNIIREAGRAFGVPLPASALAHELFGAAMAAGRGELDHSGVVTILEDLARTEVKKKE